MLGGLLSFRVNHICASECAVLGKVFIFLWETGNCAYYLCNFNTVQGKSCPIRADDITSTTLKLQSGGMHGQCILSDALTVSLIHFAVFFFKKKTNSEMMKD